MPFGHTSTRRRTRGRRSLLDLLDAWAAAVYAASSRRRCSLAGRRAPNDSRSRTAAVYTLRVGDRRKRRHRGGDPIDALPELRLRVDLSKSHLHARDILHELVERRHDQRVGGRTRASHAFDSERIAPAAVDEPVCPPISRSVVAVCATAFRHFTR